MNNIDLPLKNKIIIITRSSEQAGESSLIFERLGAKVILFPTIKIVPPKSWKEFDESVKRISEYDYIIFTSANAVNMFCNRIKKLHVDVIFHSLKVISVGSKTADICNENKIPVHLTPNKFSSKGIIEELSKLEIAGKKIFVPKSAIGRKELQDELEKLGAKVTMIDVYGVAVPNNDETKESKELLSIHQPNVFIFTSPSTFENFLKIMNLKNLKEYFEGSLIAGVGPTTKSAIEMKEVTVDIVPKEYTLEALAEELVNYFRKKGIN